MSSSPKNYQQLLVGVKTLAVVCNQWGDTGKGKFVDVFAEWADIIARGTGGANAGHTISLNGKENIFHLVPSGILHDGDGKINIIGSGVALDPKVVCEELDMLKEEGLSYKNLKISKNAKLVLPQHLVMDRARDTIVDGKIGTTGRGIGPVYEDYVARIGLTINDLLNKDIFVKKLKRNLRDKIMFLKLADQEIIKNIMQHEHLSKGRYWSAENIFDIDAITQNYMRYGERLSDMIDDTDTYLREAIGKKNILLEGAQGNLLSVDIGTYPYVTSSDCSISNLVKGVGLKENDVNLTLGIVKAYYMTRVGGGPFPTELGRDKYEELCSKSGTTKETEKKQFGHPTVNEKDEFLQSIGIRMAGAEYGATTGRPRRIGWLDLALLRHSVIYSGPNVILTKLDVLDECKEIKICHAYEYVGAPYRVGKITLKKGDRIDIAIMDNEIMKNSKPIYQTFPGWQSPLGDIRNFEDLPTNFKNILKFVADQTGIKTRVISVGPDRDQNIFI